ncbi:MAG TPA: TIGR01777 family oxidoreductase [bacterium]|nr:TIGR01777 family oxidoreductase [bacterium]
MMTVLVSGARGLIGSALVRDLLAAGDHVVRLTRASGTLAADEVAWEPGAGRIDATRLKGVDAVVHLAGESIAQARWTAERKARIWRSRVDGTMLLARALAGVASPPATMVCASAVGYYGDRGDEILREESRPGTGFLADLCREWETAAEPARARGIRVAHLRTGTVLSRDGGALPRLLPLFRFGLGGAIGSGRQYMSWITLADAVGAIRHILARDELAGPVNLVSPRPVTNREFTRDLARAVRRPAVLPVPAPILRLVFGELADETLLASTRAAPARLLATGYTFRLPGLEGALAALLN